jgi:hypothetical protein
LPVIGNAGPGFCAELYGALDRKDGICRARRHALVIDGNKLPKTRMAYQARLPTRHG